MKEKTVKPARPRKQKVSGLKYVVAQPLIGGMPIGFENAFGCPPAAIISAGFSNDLHYIKYMNETRHLGIPVINMDSTYSICQDPESQEIFESLCDGSVDCLMHVAVCAGLSMLNAVNEGSAGRGNPDNEQNKNMYALSTLGFKLKAKVVAFENAPAAYTTSGEATIGRLKEIADSFKYTTQLFKTDTLLHGIPQTRKRTFIMFYRDTNPPVFKYEHKPYCPLPEYLKEVNDSMEHMDTFVVEDSKDSFYDFIIAHSGEKTYSEAMQKLGQGRDSWTSLQLCQHIGFDIVKQWFADRLLANPDDDRATRAIRIIEHCQKKVADNKGYWDSSTYLANKGLYVNAVISKNIHSSLHPTEERGYTIRELLHLMGMPHDFGMISPKKNWNHISQNVPVKTATFIGTQIRSYIEGTLPITNIPFVKQDNTKQRLDTPETIAVSTVDSIFQQ